MTLDEEAKREIEMIPPSSLNDRNPKRKAFVYDGAKDAIAVGNTIHAVLAEKLGSKGGCAGFLQRTSENFIFITHWPESPADVGGSALLPRVVKKLKTLGFDSRVL